MYGWGGDTSDFRGSKKYSFDSARAPYFDSIAADASKTGPRAYSHKSAPDKLVDVKGKTLRSDSPNPIIVGVDVTGSMSTWPAEIFDRLPLMYQTLAQYKPDVELSFGAIGDAFSDKYPIQAAPFEKGLKLEECIKALYPEGNGGGQVSESYELYAHFLAKHCETPKATNPFLFIYGDEKFYNTVDPAQVKHYIGDTLEKAIDSTTVWKQLTNKFNLYLLHKPYGSGYDAGTDKEVIEHWAKAIGKQRIVELPSADRAVDILMGIVAKHWGHYDDFGDNLLSRQSEAVADSVHKSLRHIPAGGSKKSTTGKASKTSTKTLSELYDS